MQRKKIFTTRRPSWMLWVFFNLTYHDRWWWRWWETLVFFFKVRPLNLLYKVKRNGRETIFLTISGFHFQQKFIYFFKKNLLFLLFLLTRFCVCKIPKGIFVLKRWTNLSGISMHFCMEMRMTLTANKWYITSTREGLLTY